MSKDDQNIYRYVFVCGLPRSGTSVLGRNIGRLENCTDLRETGVFEDEGQFLQDVYPIDGDLGGAGRFGFDPRAHRTESSNLLTPANVAKLHRSWEPYWDKSKTIRVEKTPGNLLMTRFLQAAFPNCYFIVIRRHPVPVGMASQKWKVNVAPLYKLFEHWLHCHGLFEADKKYLKHVYELRYEDYIEDAEKYHKEIAAFIGTSVPPQPKEDKRRVVAQWRNPTGLSVPENAMEEVTGAHNKKYFRRWALLLTKSTLKGYYRYIASKYESRFATYGYSLIEGFGLDREVIRRGGKVWNAIGASYFRAADVIAFLQRTASRSRWRVKQLMKAALPEFILSRIRQARRRAYPSKEMAHIASR